MADNYKIVVIGDSETGKTSLLGRFVRGVYHDTNVTIGAEYNCKTHTITVDGQPVQIRMQIWDTAGQERYATLVTQFYRGCDGVVAVYDVSRPETFQHLKDHWIPEVQRVAPDTAITVVGNKLDLLDDCGTSDVIRQAKRYCEQNGFQYANCSAKTASGIEPCFDSLTETVYRNRPISDSPTFDNTVTLANNQDLANYYTYRHSSYCCNSG